MNNDELPLSFEFDKYVNLNSFVDPPPSSGGEDGSDDVNPSLKDHLRYEHPLVQRYVHILIIAAAATTSITMVLVTTTTMRTMLPLLLLLLLLIVDNDDG